EAEAVATLQEVIHRNPDHLAAHLNLAVTYVQQWSSPQDSEAQALEQALAAVHRALALNASWSWNHLVLGYVYLCQKHYDGALAEMEQGVALAANEAWGYAALADVLSRVGRTEEAREAAVQALNLKPYAADEHLASVGIAYAVAGHYEEAVAP